MCGLFGAIKSFDPSASVFSLKEEKWLRNVAVVSQIRGTDSTGVGFLSKTLCSYYKKPIISSDFITLKEIEDKLNSSHKDSIVGHVRKRTVGPYGYAGAQPYIKDNILMTHNGTLSNILIKYPSAVTDSEALCFMLAEKGIKNTVKNITGAWALVVYDSKTQHIYFTRNKERSLWYSLSQDLKTLYYASEWWMLSPLLSSAGVAIYEDNKFDDCWEFAPNHIYSIDMNDVNLKMLKGKKYKTKIPATNTNKWEKWNQVLNKDTYEYSQEKELKTITGSTNKYITFQAVSVQKTTSANTKTDCFLVKGFYRGADKQDVEIVGNIYSENIKNSLFKDTETPVLEGKVQSITYLNNYFPVIRVSTLSRGNEEEWKTLLNKRITTFNMSLLEIEKEIQEKLDKLSEGCVVCDAIEILSAYEKILTKPNQYGYICEDCSIVLDLQDFDEVYNITTLQGPKQ